jgi:glycosyltransferase involved in cell wall biosynthesis
MADEIGFYLRGRPFGGGANSVVQEFAALVRSYGVGWLVVEEQHLERFRRGYDWPIQAVERITGNPHDVPEGAAIVATTNDSLALAVSKFGKRTSRVYYYVQDYEPLFYAPHSRQHEVATQSYLRTQDAVAVVKTQWLAKTLMKNSFLPVVRIRPSIDRSVYQPTPRRTGGMRSLVAMVRPVTARRGPARTVAVLNRLAAKGMQELDIDVFGADAHELSTAGLELHRGIRNHGRVSARQAGELVRRSDFMLDLSDYQAFGRSVAEGMAAGVVPIVTDRGAPPEFVTDGRSGFLVSPQDLDGTFEKLTSALRLPDDELARMRMDAMSAVSSWSVDRTASDWFALMRDA